MGNEREIQHDPQVLAGEDDSPRQPAPPLDPYTPEPGPGPGERRPFAVMRIGIVIVLVLAVVVVVLIAGLR